MVINVFGGLLLGLGFIARLFSGLNMFAAKLKMKMKIMYVSLYVQSEQVSSCFPKLPAPIPFLCLANFGSCSNRSKSAPPHFQDRTPPHQS